MKQFYAIVDGKPCQQFGPKAEWCSESYEIPQGEDFEWCYIENGELKIDESKKSEVIVNRAAQEVEKENKKNKKNKRKQYIKDIKWSDINSIAEVKQILKLIVEELEEK